MIVRFEPWGAWVKLESMAAIVALDREGVRSLGLDGGDAWSRQGPTAPLEVHLAVTGRCGAGCQGCYLDARPDGVERPREAIERDLDALRDARVFTVAFGGGEPTTRDDLDCLARAAHERGLTPVLTTSGLGLSEARADMLSAFAQVNVSYDGRGSIYRSVRGFDGARVAEEAIERLVRHGIRVGVNVVLTHESFACLPATVSRARQLGACEAQLLRYKPAGRAASPEYYQRRLTVDQARAFGPMLRDLCADLCEQGDFHIRIDCALVPFLSADAEFATDPRRLERFGVMGCEAAGALAAVTVDGRVAPCSFAHATELAATNLAGGYPHDVELKRWRAYADAPSPPCAECSLRSVCKGGCKVVSSFVDGIHGPDPECPRVIEVREARAC